jgi:hypothetical protein
MTDEEAECLWDFSDALLEFWSPLNTLVKYMKLGLTKAVKAETQNTYAMPQWKTIAKHMKVLKSKTEPLMKRTQKNGLAWLKLSGTKKGEMKKLLPEIDRYYVSFKKVMDPIEAIQAEFDDMDDELKMEVRGSLDTKKYYNLTKYAMQSRKRVVRSYGKLRLAQIRSGGS